MTPGTGPSPAPAPDVSSDLFVLVRAGRTEEVRAIVEEDSSLVEAIDELGYTALNWAATGPTWSPSSSTAV